MYIKAYIKRFVKWLAKIQFGMYNNCLVLIYEFLNEKCVNTYIPIEKLYIIISKKYITQF